MRAAVTLLLLPAAACSEPASPPPVHHEPRHRPIFESEEARILDVRLAPGETSRLHVHAHDIFYAVLDGSNIWAETEDGTRRSVSWPDGHLSDNTSQSESPVTHRVGNSGTEPLRLLAVENLRSDPDARHLAAGRVALLGEPAVEDARFRAYRTVLRPGEAVVPHVHEYPCVLLVSDGQGVREQAGLAPEGSVLGRGDWSWLPARDSHGYRNSGAAPAVVVEVEVR